MVLQKANVTVRYLDSDIEATYESVMLYNDSEYLVICNDPETLVRQCCMYDSDFWIKKYDNAIEVYFINLLKNFAQKNNTILNLSIEHFLIENVVIFDAKKVTFSFNSIKQLDTLIL